jgi:hypothetical protein
MTHNEQPQPGAQTEKDEPVFVLRVFRVVLQPGIRVGERCGGLLERDPVLAKILGRLCLVPCEPHRIHIANVFPIALWCKENLPIVLPQNGRRGALA